ncbi:hypothetical protein PYCCODRAFT_1453306 [Trametes coccinea BRFM310]|uniref:DNA endonuclease activator Ctp1 C-terminal domain-containing protein n=1 Tax=Trametes coccinea (strain BRFM310) TaxID=1353009 RepID=A0A1Y2IKT1_TRAC3|nr:hypothetical protein PYCCODRAFT_1453306 [Trametes coccinea BRFM310]
MPKGSAAASSHIPSKQVQFLESKINKLRWLNNDLNKQVFEAVQRGHRLAAKLGFQNLEDAELALATQPRDGGQSQLEEQLSQQPPDELAAHVQDLQSELINHIHISKSTLSALEDALQEINTLREENAAVQREMEKSAEKHAANDAQSICEKSTEADYLRAELATLKEKYADLQKAKEESEKKHAVDYKRWKEFKIWLTTEERNEVERAAKRRKLNAPEQEKRAKLPDDDDSPILPPRHEWDARYGHVRKKLLASKARGPSATPARGSSSVPSGTPSNPAILATCNLNSPSRVRTSLTSPLDSSSAKIPALQIPPEVVKRRASVEIPQEDAHPSSETEPETQSVTFIYPSQIDVAAGPSSIPQKRRRSPEGERDSSETELESQAPTFVYPSQIPSDAPERVADMTPKPRPAVQRGNQLWTPISALRPQQVPKGRGKVVESARGSSPTGSTTRDIFRPAPSAADSLETKPALPETPISPRRRKGKGRVVQEDKENGDSRENTPASPSTSAVGKQVTPLDYSVFKGRGRYGQEKSTSKDTINSLYELDPTRNDGVGFQFEEVVRDKQKRKHMHAVDCECCRDYYSAIGPLPPRPQGPMWRSPRTTPSKRRRVDSFDDDEDDVAAAAMEEHKQAISRHREHWPRAKTPPRYWEIEFPTTQQVEEMNAEAARMHEEKRAMIAREAERGGRYKKR